MELEKLLEKVEKLQEGPKDLIARYKKKNPAAAGMTNAQLLLNMSKDGWIQPEDIDKFALNDIREQDKEQAKQAAQKAKQEGKTPETQGNEQPATEEKPAENTEQPADNANQETTEQPANDNNNTEGAAQPADNGNGQPEFFKDFEGKAQVSPDDVKAVLSDPTKGQQLIDWAKTQNAIVKEVSGLQNVMKAAQANNQNNGDAQNNGTDQAAVGDTAQNGGEKAAAPQRPFTDYLEPLGKIMKTQADCDKAIEFFTNLKNTKPAAAEGGEAAPETNPAN